MMGFIFGTLADHFVAVTVSASQIYMEVGEGSLSFAYKDLGSNGSASE